MSKKDEKPKEETPKQDSKPKKEVKDPRDKGIGYSYPD